jgi:hypothetical protein
MSAEAPTNAEIMAVLVGQNDRFDALDQRFDVVDQRLDGIDQRLGRVEAKLEQVSTDVIAIKVNQGYIEQHIDDLQKWARRHEADPNAHQRAA